MLKTYDEIKGQVTGAKAQRLAVVAAGEEEVLLSLQEAAAGGIVFPLLIGDGKAIEALRTRLGLTFNCDIIDAVDDTSAAEIAVQMAARGEAAGLMKGIISTSVFLKALLKRDAGLAAGGLLSHITAVESPAHGRLFLVTDAAVNIAPTLEQKRMILRNAVEAARRLGNPCPRAAILCAVEKINPAMKATKDAEELRRMNEAGEISGVTVSGPISLDLAVSSEVAAIKGYRGDVAGRADILLVPEIETGNVLVKSLFYFAGLPYGGIIMGARVPVVLTSRADLAKNKYNSIMLAAALARGD